MSDEFKAINTRGSVWHRWEPHVQTPDTVLNDQYGGTDPWELFLKAIETSEPPIRALGVTDYCSIDNYEKVLDFKRKGRLPGVGLIFPNVELRLSIDTVRASGINLHLLFAPDAGDHIACIRDFLSGLTFHNGRDNFKCTREGLTRLGKAHKAELANNDAAAHAEGTNQFKVNFEELETQWRKAAWIQQHGLVAVAGGNRDGTAGLHSSDGSFAAMRQRIERFAHIIFSGNPKQINFFLGKGDVTIDDLNSQWGGRKPCLHGSDAHSHERVGAPDLDRRCWLNGDVIFDTTLRCAAIEPDGRVYIGDRAPRGALPGNCIRSVEVSNAQWMKPSVVPLNAGMVAIIGARGSGKTALVDFIAAGGFGMLRQLTKGSFIQRASEHLNGSTVTLHWESGSDTGNELSAINAEDLLDAPHVQYLSQQFVEKLCTAEGLDDSLIAEIEKVVFEALPEPERLGAEDFKLLLNMRLETVHERRTLEQYALERAVTALNAEQLRKDNLTRERPNRQRQVNRQGQERSSFAGW